MKIAFLYGTNTLYSQSRTLVCAKWWRKICTSTIWDPAYDIADQLNKNNTDDNMPLPKNLRSAALKKITRYSVINNRIVPYHNEVHDNLSGQMPDQDNSPSGLFLALPF
jgi:hypothetical protein